MADRKANGRSHRSNGAAVEVPDVHPATYNPRGRKDAGKKANGNKNGVVANVPRERLQFNCAKCPGYCCSYPVISLTKFDVERLARYFETTPEIAEKRFTKAAHGHKRIMRRKKDEHFHMICQFFDTEKRCCTIYPARPGACRAYPGTARCGYYDFLSFERRAQNDAEFVALTDNR